MARSDQTKILHSERLSSASDSMTSLSCAHPAIAEATACFHTGSRSPAGVGALGVAALGICVVVVVELRFLGGAPGGTRSCPLHARPGTDPTGRAKRCPSGRCPVTQHRQGSGVSPGLLWQVVVSAGCRSWWE